MDLCREFLGDHIGELNVTITDWKEQVDEEHDNAMLFTRRIDSLHPLPLVLAWLPMEVTNINDHYMRVEKGDDGKITKIFMKENALVKGIPMVEPNIINEWEV